MNHLHKLPTGSPEQLEVYAVNTLNSFFCNYDLTGARHLLWQPMKQGFMHADCTLNINDSQNLITFYEYLHEMIVASSILYPNN